MRRIIITLIGCVILASCAKNSKIELTNFKDIPKEIEGCSCYFSDSKENFEKENYIFISNFEKTGFISLNGKLTKLNLLKTGRKDMTFGDYDHIDIYSNDSLKVTIDIKYKGGKEEEEVWSNTGTIKVETKDGQTLVKEFQGECGC